MPGIWIFSEDNAVARQLITAGRQLKGVMSEAIGVLTLEGTEADTFIAAGADKVIVIKSGAVWPESYASTISDIASQEGISVLLIGGTSRGKDMAATIAARLKAGLVTEAQSVNFVDGHIETTRLMYGGLAVSTEAVAFPALVTVAPRTFEEAVQDAGTGGEIIIIEAAIADERVSVSNVCPIEKAGADIAVASRIVCVGRGLVQEEDLTLVESLAKAVGGEVACTRGIAEDYHWLPVEKYIGISGQKVKPELYLSLGVSGQVQHVAGIRDSKIIVAIDSNEKAPIFEAADYGIVGDLYEIAPLLIKAFNK